jgi:repressor LexA
MDKKSQIYQFIQSEISKRGLPPTIREIGKRFDISSTNGVRYFLGRLEDEGLIKRQNRTARGISIAQARSRRSPPSIVGSIEADTFGGIRSVPILGRVPAGKPVFTEEYVEGSILLDERIARGYEVFAVKVKGDSMIGAGINDGDIAVVKRNMSPQTGDLAVALIDDEVTLKRFLKRGKSIVLKPENENYPEIMLSALDNKEIRILGTVIAIVRQY